MWTAENRPRYNRDKPRYPSDLTDEEWALVEPLILPGKRGGGKRTVVMREVMNGVMYVLSTGFQWRAIGGICSNRTSAAVQSATLPPVSRNAMGRHRQSVSAWIFVVRPPRERPIARFCPPFSAGGGAMGAHSGRVDQKLGQWTAGLHQSPENPGPNTFLGPSHEAVVERLARTIDVLRADPRSC